MPRHRKSRSEGCAVDMTPMIDVVFQLIIFFIVTIKIEQEFNPDIEMAKAPHGPVIEDEDPRQLTIEIDQRGWISIHRAQFSRQRLRQYMINRRKRYGQFPVLIRADRRTKHEDVRAVMDICTSRGVEIWRISFAAIQQEKD